MANVDSEHVIRATELEDTCGDSDNERRDIYVKETPLPWRQLLTMLAVRLSEPICFTLILPFAYSMVKDFDIAETEKDIAWYAGLITASFSICQAMTIMWWGRLSDRIGRRPVLILGLVGNFVTFILFGFSKSFGWALFSRSLNGLLNGNVVVVKSMTAEITDDTNRARGMALLPLMWNVGSMIGPVIGGMLAEPVKQYPKLFGNVKLFQEFPYLLPCLIGSSITAFGLLVGIFNLQETLASKVCAKSKHCRYNPSRPQPSDTTLVPGRDTSSSTPSIPSETTLLFGQDSSLVRKERTLKELLTPTAVIVMITNGLLCLAISMCDQLYPIFAATRPDDGGIGFSTRNIGISMALSGAVVLYMQLVEYPRLEKKKGALWCYQRGQIMHIPVYLAMPFLSTIASRVEDLVQGLVADHTSTRSSTMYIILWTVLIMLLLIRIVGNVLVFTSINLLIVNLAPTTADLGFMNGAQQLAMSSVRVIGPILSGSLWSWSIKHRLPYPLNSHLSWIACAILTAVSWYLTYRIPSSVNKYKAIEVDEYGNPIRDELE